MSVNTFPSTMVSFTIVLLIVGVVLGLLAGGYGPANLFSGVAYAGQGEDGASYLDLQRQIEMEQLRQKGEAELAALRAKYQQELALARQRHEREVELMELRAQMMNSLLPILTAAGALAVLIAGGGLAYYLGCLGRGRLLAAQACAFQVNWQDGIQRAEAVRLAREAERSWRAAQRPAAGGNGHDGERLGQALGQR